jgi:hypothetical protein
MRLGAIGTAGVLVAAGLAIGVGPANADSSPDLYVNQYVSNCGDSTTDSAVAPFCTIQAAADVAQPGQTVVVTYGDRTLPNYASAAITHSGTPGHPITFDGVDTRTGSPAMAYVGQGAGGGLAIDGAHDIVLENFDIKGSADGVSINNSTDVTADRLLIESRPNADGIDLTGTTSNVTISRSNIGNEGTGGTLHDVWIGQGISHTTVTTNQIGISFGPGTVTATDAPDTIVTSNTITFSCASGIDLAGNSAGSVIENNIVQHNDAGTPAQCDPTVGEIAVSAGSTANTISDYNIISGYDASDHLYNWNGTAYTGLSAFAAATGQGTHDLDPGPIWPQEVPGDIDSADANAPGELSTDVYGNARVDDAAVPNTGTGPGYYDRGAVEDQDPLAGESVSTNVAYGEYPVTVTAAALVSNPWSDPLTYSFDFGDGGQPVRTSNTTASYTYTTASPPGGFTITVTVTAPDGATSTITAFTPIQVVKPGPTAAAFSLHQSGSNVNVDGSASTDPWPITGYTFSYGDGTAEDTAGPMQSHSYAKPGRYDVALTITDSAGRTASDFHWIYVTG